MTTALSVYDQFDELQRAAIALQESGYFSDVTSKAQAIVKVMAGAELGLPPFASMTGIHIIQGKPVLGANVIATLVKNDPRYDYHIITAPEDQEKEMFLEWSEGILKVGVAGYTLEEAKKAGLVNKDNWKKYPSDMLFARAISRGARRYAPGIFGGSPFYTPDEMGADVDEDGSVIVDSVAVDIPTPIEQWAKGPPAPQPDAPKPETMTKPKPETNGKGNDLEAIYQAVVDAGLSENPHAAKKALGKCKTGYETAEMAIAWMTAYRGFRDMGGTVPQAAKNANAGEVPK